MLIAVLGGLGAALLWAASNLASSRSTRMIGSMSVLAWVMAVGLVLDVLFIIATRTPVTLDRSTLGWMAVAGFGNAFGLLLLLSSLRLGKVGLATSITSTEGAVAAVYSVLAGEKLPTAAYVWLAVIVLGVVGATLADDQHAIPGERRTLAALMAIGAALISGASIYATGFISNDVALAWVLLPPRIVGVVVIAVPLALAHRLQLNRASIPLVLVTGVAEIAGWLCYAVGARYSIAVAAVLSSLFAAFATIGAFTLFRERLSRHQLLGVGLIIAGVATLTATIG